ncbi:helix-turn-helix transcriptional regulator [Streptomyces pluripotens]|uniref:Helix-turn-helix transcriptional regulator n=1 Tax=Streptomyces pluripotens TaxID=1355015 RepID=A0A221NYR9_9ACTN|nr:MULTISPECIES: LuxR C-terminal-related transcriptional regulator [Streptomyces]ARP70704.1 helix-turn-helix transcriptional regulator [Streptomyces pluripotens]ASN24966.1 helix-turn-helix transcriptional regulator [Streptomyces pluripotens]KIE27433.1 erythropoiesis-stimulating protein [Streptomyces sp. MUSC 125]MCH0556598.1 helix-turn-helix transcriptional regulator [Streptomyces sp. MUM 16J]
MLDVLGLDSEAEAIYRGMLTNPRDGVACLAARLGLAEERVRSGLDRLSELALIQPSAREGIGFRAIGPEAAMKILLARQQAELVAQQMRVEASRAAAAQLIAECSSLRTVAKESESEQLTDLEAIRERLAELAQFAQYEVATFAPGGAHLPDDLATSWAPNPALLNRGVRTRTIYLDSMRNHPPTRDHARWLHARDRQVRTAPDLPIRMIIFDRSRAVLPIDTDDARAGGVVLSGAGTVVALCALFESVWSTATPLGAAPKHEANGMPPQERAVLKMLAQGSTDESIAKRLGVSPRTARRIAATLMERLDARSRFEAGVHAVQDGWLPATR